MRTIKYLLASIMGYDFELFLAMFSSLFIVLLLISLLQRYIFNAEYPLTATLRAQFNISADSLLMDLFEELLNITQYFQRFTTFDWLQKLIMTNGGKNLLTRNGETLNDENNTAYETILGRMCTNDRTVSHIFFKSPLTYPFIYTAHLINLFFLI